MLVKTSLVLCSMAFALTGCDAVVGHAVNEINRQEPTIVIHPGYQVLIDGVPTPIFGFEKCPTESAFMNTVFGPPPDQGSNKCILLDKQNATVRVLFKSSQGMTEEEWTVIHGENKKYGQTFPSTALQRPDGSPVIPA